MRKTTLTALAVAMVATLLLSATPAEARHPYQGYIYGKVTTRSGNEYTGLLRWGTEEAFWDDIFHSYKETRPYSDLLDDAIDIDRGEEREMRSQLRDFTRQLDELRREEDKLERSRRKTEDLDKREELDDRIEKLNESREELSNDIEEMEYELEEAAERSRLFDASRSFSALGGAISINVRGFSGSRIFAARFGDIDRIEVIGSEDAELTMKSGTVYTVSGYANDVGGTIQVRDKSLGDIKLEWRKIDTIQFMETPKEVHPEGYRLHGTLSADGVEYRGFIQWDSEECLSTDKLDGNSDDGRLAIDMGNIKSIERRSRNGSIVELKDGRRLNLEGTNDVDGSIRGIMVEDERYGRLKVNWDAFEKLVFDDESGSGKAYSDYKKPTQLQGTVTDVNGNTYEGLIVYDIDESESWEMLDGDLFDIEFIIPFGRVKQITPRSRNSCTVVLRNGESLRLEGGQDVSNANDGLMILKNAKDKEPKLLSWESVETIEFK